MTIQNSTMADVEEIFRLYALPPVSANKRSVSWPAFERSMVETEIIENHQWKMTEDETVACVWATTFSDPLIWENKNEEPAIYIHRIAINPISGGRTW